jgi:hypothetical protein
MGELPPWVYDVVIELQRWNDVHPKLYAEVLDGGEFVKQRVDDCGCKPLDLVPDDVKERAKSIGQYLAAKNGGTDV